MPNLEAKLGSNHEAVVEAKRNFDALLKPRVKTEELSSMMDIDILGGTACCGIR